LLMPQFLDKALRLKACTNPRMQGLHGRRDRPSMWTSSVSRQMAAMCSQVTYLALITLRISGRTGTSVRHLGTARLVAASLLIHLKAPRYSLATSWGCFCRRTAVLRGSRSMKAFRNARAPMSKLRAPIATICLPALLAMACGVSCWEVEHQPRRRLRPLL